MTIEVRSPREADRADWERLYAGYAEFYRVAQTPAMRARVWDWIADPEHATEARVAAGPGGLVGLAHFRGFARPLAASTGGFLDDLYVAPDARGRGVAEALIAAVRAIGAARGWTVVRWITAADNARARAFYHRVAEPTHWVTYDLRP